MVDGEWRNEMKRTLSYLWNGNNVRKEITFHFWPLELWWLHFFFIQRSTIEQWNWKLQKFRFSNHFKWSIDSCMYGLCIIFVSFRSFEYMECNVSMSEPSSVAYPAHIPNIIIPFRIQFWCVQMWRILDWEDYFYSLFEDKL